MPDYKKNNRFGGKPNRSFGPRRDSGRGFLERERYDAECSSCHKECQVPFRPNGKKPVFCSDCFKRDGDRPARSGEWKPARSFARPDAPAPDRRIDDLARKLDSVQAALERLTAALEGANRAEALARTVRDHAPAEALAKAPKKTKKPAKRPAKV